MDKLIQIKQGGQLPAEMMPQTAEQALQILKTYPQEYYQALRPKTLTEVFDSPNCSMAKFRAETSPTVARALMAYIIADFIESLNVGKTMNDIQTARACDLILDEYYFLKPDDFKLCFNRVLIGRYGTSYDRIDVQVICGWIDKYVSDRMNAADDISYQQHNEIKERSVNETNYLIDKKR